MSSADGEGCSTSPMRQCTITAKSGFQMLWSSASASASDDPSQLKVHISPRSGLGPSRKDCWENACVPTLQSVLRALETLSLEGKLCHQLIVEPIRSQQTWPSLVPTLQGRVPRLWQPRRCVPEAPALLPAGQPRCFFGVVGPITVRPSSASQDANCASSVVASPKEGRRTSFQLSSQETVCLETALTSICAAVRFARQEIRSSCGTARPHVPNTLPTFGAIGDGSTPEKKTRPNCKLCPLNVRGSR